jgi:hypothetical protein
MTRRWSSTVSTSSPGETGRPYVEVLACQGPAPRGRSPPVIRAGANNLDDAIGFQSERCATTRRREITILPPEDKAGAFVFLVGMDPRGLNGFPEVGGQRNASY